MVVQTAADAPLVEATRARMVRPLMRMYPDTLDRDYLKSVAEAI